LVEGIEIWEGHFSTNAVEAVVENKLGTIRGDWEDNHHSIPQQSWPI
jgi:hypothetical protein